MKSWQINDMDLLPQGPQVLSTADEGRAIALALRAGERLDEHQVHERAWIVVLDGEVSVTAPDGSVTTGGAGLLVEQDPGERHAVAAIADARILLLLTPWPGTGHPRMLSQQEAAASPPVPQEAT
jgi:quercetin dioxygenase-like cupin family protein